MIKRFIKYITVALVLVIATGCGILKKDINIIYTSDIHCNMDGDLDYASVKEYKDYIKSKGGYTVLVDGGDFIQGGMLGESSKGKAVIELMNDLGYDVASLGNHEFDYGLDALKECIDLAKFDIVDCNVQYLGDGDNPLDKVMPYVIKRYGPTKIAYIGILTPETLLEREPSYVALCEDGDLPIDLYADPNGGDNADALFDVIQRTIDEVRDKVDYVVAIAHIGVNSSAVINSYELIEYTKGLDVVLDAHAHKNVNDVVQDIEGKDVVLLSVGKELDRIGLVTISKEGTIIASTSEGIEKNAKFENELMEKLAELYSQIDEEEE